MARVTLKPALASLALAGILAAMAFPGAARAQSSDPRVWVVDDTTAQALATCTRPDGTACPSGAIQTFHVFTMPLATAQTEHRPYLQAVAPSQEDLHRFVHQTFPPPQPIAHPTVATLSPLTCPSTLDNYWDFNVPPTNAEVKAHQSVQKECNGQYAALTDNELYVSGPGTWRSDSANVYDHSLGDTYEDSDNGSGCDGLNNHTYTFSVHAFTASQPYTEVFYFSGSACQSWDGSDFVDYYWYNF